MPWITVTISSALAGAIALMAINLFLYRQERKPFIAIWAFSWAIYAVRMVFHLAQALLADQSWFTPLAQALALLSGLVLCWGAFLFLGRSIPWIAGILVFVLNTVWIMATFAAGHNSVVVATPGFFTLGTIYIWLGWIILRGFRQATAARQLTGWAFIIWGIHKFDYPFLIDVQWFAPIGFLLGLILEITVAVGMLALFYRSLHEELAERERRFRLLADHAQDIIYRYRLVPERGFEYVSPAATEMLGYSPEEHYADPDLGVKLVHPDDQHLLISLFASVEAIGKPLTLRWIRKDGRIIWTEQRNTPILDRDGTLVAVEGVARDVTALLSNQQRLEQFSVELEMRNRELELFASRIAQELRVPLRHVTGFIEVIRQEHGDSLGESGRHALTIVGRSVQRILDISMELDDLARLSTWQFTPESVNLSLLAAEISESFRQREPERRLDIAIDENLTVRGDRRSLRLALHHLIENSVTYTRGVSAAAIRIGCREGGPEKIFFVEDNGVGIPADKMPHVFLPFYRAHESHFEGGAGLGLTAVKKVIENHGGRVWVDGDLKRGARICFTLP